MEDHDAQHTFRSGATSWLLSYCPGDKTLILVSPDIKDSMGFASSGPQHLWLALGPSQCGKPVRQVHDEQLIRKGKSVGPLSVHGLVGRQGRQCVHTCVRTLPLGLLSLPRQPGSGITTFNEFLGPRSCHRMKVCGLEIQGECTDLTGRWTCPGWGGAWSVSQAGQPIV